MFLTNLSLDEDTRDGLDRDYWFLCQPLVWKDPTFGTLTVPPQFRTDLASIPRLLRNIPFLDPDGLSRRSAAMHDWLYAWRQKGKDFADAFLRAALLAEGASKAVAGCFYAGVHLFGQSSWDSDAGTLETVDFRTPEDYRIWRSTPDGWGHA